MSELARRLGMSRMSFYRYLDGKRAIPASIREQFLAVCKEAKLQVTELVTGKE